MDNRVAWKENARTLLLICMRTLTHIKEHTQTTVFVLEAPHIAGFFINRLISGNEMTSHCINV